MAATYEQRQQQNLLGLLLVWSCRARGFHRERRSHPAPRRAVSSHHSRTVNRAVCSTPSKTRPAASTAAAWASGSPPSAARPSAPWAAPSPASPTGSSRWAGRWLLQSRRRRARPRVVRLDSLRRLRHGRQRCAGFRRRPGTRRLRRWPGRGRRLARLDGRRRPPVYGAPKPPMATTSSSIRPTSTIPHSALCRPTATWWSATEPMSLVVRRWCSSTAGTTSVRSAISWAATPGAMRSAFRPMAPSSSARVSRRAGRRRSSGTTIPGWSDSAICPAGPSTARRLAVSANGRVVVGVSQSASGPQAFRWTAETGMVGLGDLPGGGFGSEAAGRLG